MIQSQMPGGRAKQVLSILASHGPLSSKTLRVILEPPIQPRRLRDTLKRLLDRGYITRRYDQVFGGSGAVYQITRERSRWPAINQLVGNPASGEFLQNYFSHRELHHMQACAIWAETFKRWFPEAVVQRDHQYASNSALLETLILSNADITLPDILLILPTQERARRVTVAVEIERTRKTDRRLAQKLAKYAIRTRLDGVIYISETDRILDTIRAIYSSKLMKKALRISHYGEHFLMLSSGQSTADGSDLKMANAALGSMTLRTWLQELVDKSCNARRDAAFLQSASGG